MDTIDLVDMNKKKTIFGFVVLSSLGIVQRSHRESMGGRKQREKERRTDGKRERKRERGGKRETERQRQDLPL